jgi:hypothetical protein
VIPEGYLKVVDILNQTVGDLGYEGASPYGGLDGIESYSLQSYYYVSDLPAGKIYRKFQWNWIQRSNRSSDTGTR